MKKVLILHAWYDSPASNWYPWLKKELEKRGYEVNAPELPTMGTGAPDMKMMLKFIFDNNLVDKDTVVIGHSLGAVLALRLAERVKFKQGILLAGWDYNDLTPEHQNFWVAMTDHTTIKKNVPSWVTIISDNDPYVTKAIAHEMAGRLGAKIVDAGVKGHFLAKDGVTEVPEILAFI
jgi:hypothetical protein